MDEVSRLKARYGQQIEDGKKIEAFTSTNEWSWYVDHVLQPTINEYTERIMSGEIKSDKEDWVLRGMVQGLRLVISTTETFKRNASEAKKKSKALQEAIEADE
jgi:hypothetical protein